MRIVHFEKGGAPGIAADEGSGWHGLTQRDSGFPGTLPELIAQGADLLRIGRSLGQSPAIDLNAVRLLPPVPVPPKILAVGLNYDDHLEESGLKKPDYPEIFARFATSLIAHQEPIRRPEFRCLRYRWTRSSTARLSTPRLCGIGSSTLRLSTLRLPSRIRLQILDEILGFADRRLHVRNQSRDVGLEFPMS